MFSNFFTETSARLEHFYNSLSFHELFKTN
nr:MAG TPA: hypothetical protein [Bacteriophage sp.]